MIYSLYAFKKFCFALRTHIWKCSYFYFLVTSYFNFYNQSSVLSVCQSKIKLWYILRIENKYLLVASRQFMYVGVKGVYNRAERSLMLSLNFDISLVQKRFCSSALYSSALNISWWQQQYSLLHNFEYVPCSLVK